MVDHLSRLSATDPPSHAAFKTIEAWKGEYTFWRTPIRWIKHQRVVNDVLKQSQAEADDYKRARRAVFSWVLLVVASIFSTLASLFTLLFG